MKLTVGRIVHVGITAQYESATLLQPCAAMVTEVDEEGISFTVFLPGAVGLSNPRPATFFLRLIGDDTEPTTELKTKRWMWPPSTDGSMRA